MATYYVDYENVHNGGMRGIEGVGSNDQVYALYSSEANTMTMETSKCEILVYKNKRVDN